MPGYRGETLEDLVTTIDRRGPDGRLSLTCKLGGSVAGLGRERQQCAYHAECPVVIVRASLEGN